MKDPKKKRRKNSPGLRALFVPAVFILCWLWSWVPVVEHMDIDLAKTNDASARIVLITDLHSCYYGPEQKWLLDSIVKEEPDAVMISGDFFDDVLDNENSRITVRFLADRYPCFYVTGNHEFWSGQADEMKHFLRDTGVTVLEGDCVTQKIGGLTMDICGIDDPTDIGDSAWRAQLSNAASMTDDDHVKLLLSHRPERVGDYEDYDFDLILTGHAHAGQIRIPFINRGLLAPDQGFFARYVNGAYTLSNGSVMIVSRGLGRESTIAPRFFNHPELVVIDIR